MRMMFVKHGARAEEEAAALAAARHPGVVELVDVADGALRTVRVDGRSLAELAPLVPDEVAGVAAAVATTLADLHERGVAHGGLEPSHVLVATDGRILLCSLGRPAGPGDDVAALGRLVADLLEASPPGRRTTQRRRPARWDRRPARLGSLLAPPAGPELAALAARAADPDPSRRPSARQVAAFVHQRVPTARLPAVPPGGPVLDLPPVPPAPRRGRRSAVLAVAVAATGLVAGALLLLPPGGHGPSPAAAPPRSRPAPASTTTAPEPVAERVWPRLPLDVADGVLTFDGVRYSVGDPGDAVVAGDWACTGERTVALLRPASGEVFAFDAWARPGADVTARPLGVVEGATALRVTDPDGDGCDDLEVERIAGAPVPVRVRT